MNLVDFRQALVSNVKLTRDECGDLRLAGKFGHIYAAQEGFYLYCAPGSARAWTFAKKAMFFAKVTQDGDDEGFLFMDRIPIRAEADIIRRRLGLKKKSEYGEGKLDHLVKFHFRPRALGGPDAPETASDDSEVPG